jgi:Kdo2-lipid IVA lauroyltransferase/acyltransferase
MYYLVYIPLYLLSLLPFRVLYFLGDMVYGFLYYIMRYRRKVVMSNLQIAFPDKTEEERKKIAKRFYHNFVDNFIETLKFLSISTKEFERRLEFDTTGIERAYPSGKPVQMFTMHNFSWEFANWGMARRAKYPVVVIYMPVSNKHIDRIILDMRRRFGSVMIPATAFRRQYIDWAKKQHMMASVADQSPGNPSHAWWFNFFGKPTPFVTGPEKGARVSDSAVVFVTFYRVRRGYYKVVTEFITDDIRSFPEKEITRQYVRFVERSLGEHPDNYLWSHRRWKHEYKPEYGEIVD